MGLLDKLRGTDKAPPPKAVIAAAMPMNGPGVTRVNRGRSFKSTELWQNESWYFYDAIGEVRGPITWIANAVSQADVHATELDPETGKPTGPTDNPVAVAAASLVLGGVAQRSGLLRLISLCWQVVGEAWVIVRPAVAGRPDKWLVLSGNKVTAKGESWQYTDPFTMELVTLGPQDRMLRVWQPHPNDQSKADSAMRPALPVCRECEKSSQAIAATLDSRIGMNGAWLIPEEADLPLGDHETAGAALMDVMLTMMETSLQNPGQAAGRVPLVVTMPGEFIGNAVFQDFATAFDAAVVELRDNALSRLASALDMPKDVAQGTQGESNHWSAWQVEESTYKIFIEPLLKAIGDAITEHWFRPALIAMGMSPEESDRYEIGWDTTSIVARPDDRETLESLYDKILISDEYMLTENGVTLDAMPDPEERTRRLLEKIVVGAPTLLADPNVAEAMGLEIEVSPVAAGVDAEVGAGGELVPPEPDPVPNALPGATPDTQNDVPEGLVAAAELIVYDALSRAGGRLLTNQNRGQFKSTPRHELHTVIQSGEASLALLEGSFQFTDRVAAAFGAPEDRFRGCLERYCIRLLLNQRSHDREELSYFLHREVR